MKTILIVSHGIEYGTNIEAELLTSLFKEKQTNCSHVNLRNDDSIILSIVPDYVVVFYDFYDLSWNDRLVAYCENELPNSKILLYTYCVQHYCDELLCRYPQVEKVVAGSDLRKCVEVMTKHICCDIKPESEKKTIVLSKTHDATDDLPWADRTDILNNKFKHAFVITSTYCENSCSFCHEPKGEIKYRSVDDILAEVINLKNEHHIQGIHFHGRLFYNQMNKGSVRGELMENMIRADLKVPFSINGDTAFINQLTPNDLEQLKKAGLYRVHIGIESFSPEDLARYRKLHTPDDVFITIARCKEFDIDITAGFINFNPYTTTENLTINLEGLLKADLCRLSLLSTAYIPIRGTPFYQKVYDDKLLMKNNGLLEGILFENKDIETIYNTVKDCYRILLSLGFSEGENMKEMVSYLKCIAYMYGDAQLMDIANKYSIELMNEIKQLQQRAYDLFISILNERFLQNGQLSAERLLLSFYNSVQMKKSLAKIARIQSLILRDIICMNTKMTPVYLEYF